MARDPYKYFRIEARELVEQLGKGLLELEKGSPPAEIVPLLFRLAHTLKGAARVVKQAEIATLAHSIEDALTPLREHPGSVPHERVNVALTLVDAISALVTALGSGDEGQKEEAPRARAEEPLGIVRADVAEMDAFLGGVSEAFVELRSMRRQIGVVERARHLAELLVQQLAPSRDALRAGGGAVPSSAASLAEELRAAVTSLDRSLASGLERVDREMGQVRDAAERLRLMPASAVFASLERAVRDAAQALGKRVIFEARGGDVRLEARVLGALQGALIQGVRNAVAHGIEPGAERAFARKPAAGCVTVEVARRGSRVAFLCRDDGRGIDMEAVRRAAQRKGLVSGDALKLGSEELLGILLKGGLTTSGAVTEVSGRGIGLDVVREAAAQLGGEVAIRTEPGRGTTLEIVVSMSLSSVDAVIVEASGVAAAIPLDAVRRTLRVAVDELARTADGDTLAYEGEGIPFVPLSCLLGGAGDARDRASWSAVIVNSGAELAAVGVGRLLGTTNVVVRPLPALGPADPVVAGASLDAEGNARLVLDPVRLVAAAARGRTRSIPEAARRRAVLVVDDSLTTRMLEQSILESAGYDVDVAASGEEAFVKAFERPYRLFLVDVEMPGMDGFTFVKRASADAALRDIPSILVTSRSSPEDRKRGKEAGARAYMVKSEFDQVHLLETIRALVES